MDRGKLSDTERKMVAEWDEEISTLEQRIAEAQERLAVVRRKRAAVTGESNRRGASPLGLKVIAANNVVRRLRKEGASKTEITRAQRELDDLRALLKQHKGGRQ